MSRTSRSALVVFFAAAIMIFGAFSAQGQIADGAQMRFVHALPGAGAVDVYVNSTLAIVDLAFGEASPYLAVPAGTYSLSVTQSGEASPLWQQEVALAAGGAKTLIVSSINPLQFSEFAEDLNPVAFGKARFTAVHAIADAPAVDIVLTDGRPVVPGLAYNTPYGTLDLPALTYELAVVPGGAALAEAIIPAAEYSLNSGESYMIVAYGTAADPDIMVLQTAARAEAADPGALRLAHLLPDAAEVDLFLNDTLVSPKLAFGESTGFMQVAPGSYNIAVRPTGSPEALATGVVEVVAGEATSAYIVDSTAPRITTASAALSQINATSSLFTLVNATGGDASVSAALADGTPLGGVLSSGAVESTIVQPRSGGVTVSLDSSAISAEFPLALASIYGGVYFNAIAVTGADGDQVVLLDPVAVAQSLNSAPIVAPAEVVVPPTEVPPPPTATPAPIVAPVEPTATSSVVINPEPTVAPATEGPTARVRLNPGANLHLRQYPSSEAFSLGLVQSGSVLLVLGRAGEPEPPLGSTPDPNAEEFIDPATELEEDEDLDPGTTWLNVIFVTEDGGSVTAWVNALYLSVLDVRGLPQRLADLPMIPSNRAGFAQATSIQPPTAPDRTIFAFTGNVAPGARVHIRRTPDTAAESLALVPGDVRLIFQGLNEDRDWYFVRYEDASAVVEGWISSLYVVSFEQLGRVVDLERIESLGELVTLTGEERGGVVTFAAPTSAVPESIRDLIVGEVFNLNVGTNLHLRRYDDAAAESLALLSGGTVVTIDARNEDGSWLRATYDGTVGWVSSQYVRLTLNGEAYDLNELPVVVARPLPTETPEDGSASGNG
ncbi:MAG: DUF4397 domain-containing protein [Anaerolineae bacterium]|nr:DUF4397 domain-containing protein [Anaerolineae bacterium]NUQ02385.1 DUF4397 domain-containing protein [Anaerolineae bacterium]